MPVIRRSEGDLHVHSNVIYGAPVVQVSPSSVFVPIGIALDSPFEESREGLSHTPPEGGDFGVMFASCSKVECVARCNYLSQALASRCEPEAIRPRQVVTKHKNQLDRHSNQWRCDSFGVGTGISGRTLSRSCWLMGQTRSFALHATRLDRHDFWCFAGR